MLQREVAERRPWVPSVVLAVTAAVTCAASWVAWHARSAPHGSTHVAIRVDCRDRAVCERAEARALDVWSEERGPGLPLDVVVDRSTLDELRATGARIEVLVPDVDAAARVEAERLRHPTLAAQTDFFGEFRDYRAITAHLQDLVDLAPSRTQLVPLGSSLEGRTLWALRIGTANADATPMLINGTQHAREWISAMVTTCVADRLVRGYTTDPAIKDFVDHTTLWVVPVVNPDGYQYSWSGNRYWRKNRRDRHGVDLNRNWGIAWGGDGASDRKSSDVYRGAYAFSEPETAALRDLAKRESIALHIDFHAYGQLLLYPWGYTASPAKDRDRFAAVGDRLASALFAAHGTRYTLMPSVELYPASGTMTDWMYGDVSAFSYTIELRPKGGSGFVLPPEQIRPTCDEGLAAVLALRGGKKPQTSL